MSEVPLPCTAFRVRNFGVKCLGVQFLFHFGFGSVWGSHFCSILGFVCVYVRTYVCIYVCMYVYMYVCMYVCMYVFMCVCIYVCMCVCMPLCIFVCMYVCMHVCMYVEGVGLTLRVVRDEVVVFQLEGREAARLRS